MLLFLWWLESCVEMLLVAVIIDSLVGLVRLAGVWCGISARFGKKMSLID